MSKLDFVTAFYNNLPSHDRFIDDLDSLLSSGDLSVAAMPFSTAATPSRLFSGYQSKGKRDIVRDVTVLHTLPGLQLCELRYDFQTAGEAVTQTGRFFILENAEFEHVFTAFTIEPAVFFHRGLLPLLRGLFPTIVLGFVPHKRLWRLLTEFKTDYAYSDILVTRAVERLWLHEQGPKRKAMPAVTWPRMSLEKTSSWLRSNNGWLETIDFQAKRNDLISTEIKLTREGLVRTTRLLSQAYAAFIRPFCKIHHDNFNLFSNRGRLDNDGLMTRPLVIDFASPRFSTHSENARLIKALDSMRFSSLSVLHANPYVHLSMIDYYDGSTFDIWVLDTTQVFIVSQMYASVGAIQRLVNHIFDTYAEGDVYAFEDTQR